VRLVCQFWVRVFLRVCSGRLFTPSTARSRGGRFPSNAQTCHPDGIRPGCREDLNLNRFKHFSLGMRFAFENQLPRQSLRRLQGWAPCSWHFRGLCLHPEHRKAPKRVFSYSLCGAAFYASHDCQRASLLSLARHEVAYLREWHRFLQERERSFLLHFLRCGQEPSHRRPM
jgi:hypothetical protein